MSFKNAFKLLMSKFRYVWSILLYVTIMVVILVSLGLTFITPVYKMLVAEGVVDEFTTTVNALFMGETLQNAFARFGALLEHVRILLTTDVGAFWNSALFVVLVVVIAYRFLLGLCELPITSVISGFMNDNSRLSLTGQYLSLIGKSSQFSLAKMLIMVFYDALTTTVTYFVTMLVSSFSIIFAPVTAMTFFIFFTSFRYGLTSAWAPYTVVEKGKIFASFRNSVKFFFTNFTSIFSGYLVIWLMIIVVNVFVAIFTFLAGLIITVPVSMYLVSLYSMTVFYSKKGKSYYIDKEIYVASKY